MLSFGIRFGQGFDRSNILKIMQSIPLEWDYDFLVIGSNPGGVACVREASLAGKKTAIIRWPQYSPAEEEGFDEDLEEAAEILDEGGLRAQVSSEFDSQVKLKKSKSSINSSAERSRSTFRGSVLGRNRNLKRQWWRKVRESRLDLNNELFKRGKQGRKLMLHAATMQNRLENAVNFGWRVPTSIQSLTINWKKMSELIMDYIMKENWTLKHLLAEEGVEVINGRASFVNNHTVKIVEPQEEYEITADIICTALSGEYLLPDDIPGALKYGITCDDFVRLCEPPGKTLVVGSTPEGLECASVVACFHMPVVVVSRSKLLNGYDSEMATMVIDDLKSKGVTFWEETTLTSIKLIYGKKLLASFSCRKLSENGEPLKITEDEFDTVVFAIGKETCLEYLNLSSVGITPDLIENKIITNEQNATCVPNVYAIGDAVAYHPQSFEISETAGRLLGKRLFREGAEIMDYSMVPFVILTPLEYAHAGLSEDGAIYRFGRECIEVFQSYFTPIELEGSYPSKQCFVKAVIFKPKDWVVGLHMFGPEAGEVIQGFAAAIKLGLTMNNLRSLVGIPGTKAQELSRMEHRRSLE